MLVYPRSAEVDIVYRRNSIDWAGVAITLVALALLATCSTSSKASAAAISALARALSPLLHAWSRWRAPLSVLLIVCIAATAAGTRWILREPDQEYKAAQDAYKARDFPRAVQLYEDWTKTDRDTFKQATALFQLGVSHSELGHHAAAIAVHERLRFQFPNVDYTAGTLFHLASNYAAIGALDDARTRATELVNLQPDSVWARRVRKELPQLVTGSVQR